MQAGAAKLLGGRPTSSPYRVISLSPGRPTQVTTAALNPRYSHPSLFFLNIQYKLLAYKPHAKNSGCGDMELMLYKKKTLARVIMCRHSVMYILPVSCLMILPTG